MEGLEHVRTYLRSNGIKCDEIQFWPSREMVELWHNEGEMLRRQRQSIVRGFFSVWSIEDVDAQIAAHEISRPMVCCRMQYRVGKILKDQIFVIENGRAVPYSESEPYRLANANVMRGVFGD